MAPSRSSTQVAVTKRWTNVLAWIALTALSVGNAGAGQLAPPALSGAQIDEALQLAQDDKAAQTFLNLFTLQTRTGSGMGPAIGRLSTPFSRTVLAAVAAKQSGQSFGRDDVAYELLRPEILVIASPQPAANADALVLALPKDIAIGKRVGTEVEDLLLPLRVRSTTLQERKLYNLDSMPGVIVASFSFDALAEIFDTRDFNFVVRVTFDRIAKGSTPMMGCKDCAAPISPRIR